MGHVLPLFQYYNLGESPLVLSGIYIWAVYGAVGNLSMREMQLDSNLATMQRWVTPAIVGFGSPAGEFCTALAPKPNDPLGRVYVGTRDNANNLYLYVYTGGITGGTPTLLLTIAAAANTSITAIWVCANSNRVFFGIGDRDGNVLANAAWNGLYYAPDGLTFTRMSSGKAAGNSDGVQDVFFDESTQLVWTTHFSCGADAFGNLVISASADFGATMIGHGVAGADVNLIAASLQGFPTLAPTGWVLSYNGSGFGANPAIRTAANPAGLWAGGGGVNLFNAQEGIFVDATTGVRAHPDTNATNLDWWMTDGATFQYPTALGGPRWTNGPAQRVNLGAGRTYHWTKKWVAFCGRAQAAEFYLLQDIGALVSGSNANSFFPILLPGPAQAVAFVGGVS